MAPAVLAGQGIGLERAAGGKGAAKPRLPQRLWWRFVDAGDEGPAVRQMHSLLASSLGVAIGEVLSQSLAGSSASGLARLQKVGCGLLDRHARGRLVREHLAPEGAAAAVWASLTDASNRMWAPVLSCAFFAALKVVEGQSGDLLHVCQDKVLVMVISNYVLWPLASALNAHLVPEQHRRVAGHIITIIWNAWLSALLSQASVLGGPAALAEHAGRAAAAAGHSAVADGVLASVDAVDKAQGATALARKLPPNLIEKAFSRSLDLINPLRDLERTPSTVGMAGADPVRRALQRAATRVLQRSDTAGFIASQLSGAADGAGAGVGSALSV